MSKGRIIKRAVLARLAFMTAALLVYAPAVHAQQGNPEVYIDMGALQGAGPAPSTAPARIKLKPPIPKPPQEQGQAPRLTAPVAQPSAPPPAPSAFSTPAKVAPVVPVVAKPPVVKAAEKKQVAAPPLPEATKPAYVSKPPEMPQDKMPLKSAPPPPDMRAVDVKPVVATPSPPPAVPPAAVEEAPVTATIFPVETRIRNETTDPALSDSSRPVPVRSGIAGNLNIVVPSQPLSDKSSPPVPAAPVRDLTEQDAPIKQPEAKKQRAAAKTAPLVPDRKPQRENTKTAKAAVPAIKIDDVKEEPQKVEEAKTEEKKAAPPFVPPRRPGFVEKAPAELVAELRAREAGREAEEVAHASGGAPAVKASVNLSDPLPPPGPRGKKNMPAVAKAAVDAEPIGEQTVKLPSRNDPLLDSLVEKDKESLVATIESMVAAREDGKPLPQEAKPKRETGTNIVKAEPIQRPYNVYRPQKAEEKSIDLKVGSVRPPPPREQDEQAYVSVPFAAGLTEIDAKIISEIEKRILPVLAGNPGWKIQIQAYASPVKDGVSSARKASLARALSVRTFLLGKGIDATRMDVRALGAESDRDPMDRVDLIVFDPAKKS